MSTPVSWIEGVSLLNATAPPRSDACHGSDGAAAYLMEGRRRWPAVIPPARDHSAGAGAEWAVGAAPSPLSSFFAGIR